MSLARKRLNQSILRKKILKEITFLLENYTLIKESLRSSNLRDYLEAANIVFEWAKQNRAYDLLTPEEYYNKKTDDFEGGEFGEEYENAKNTIEDIKKSADHHTDASNNFLNFTDLLKTAPSYVVRYADIVISDDNRQYWHYVDNSPRWAKSNYVGTKKYPNGGLWQIARSIAGTGASSRAAIQSQGHIIKRLTFFTYFPDDWDNVVKLWDAGHKIEAAMALLDLFSVFDLTGMSDILGGILLIAQGIKEGNDTEVLFGILMIGMGATNLGLLVADIISLGATSPLHGAYIASREVAWHGGLRGLSENGIKSLERLAYGSTRKIEILQASKSQGNKMAGDFLEQASLRAREVLDSKARDQLTVKDVEYITGKNIDDLMNTKFVDPISAADRKLIYDLAKPKISKTSLLIQSPFAIMTFENYYGIQNIDYTKKRAFSRAIYDLLKNVCRGEGWSAYCKYVTYDYEKMSVVPKKLEPSEIDSVYNSLFGIMSTGAIDSEEEKLKQINSRIAVYIKFLNETLINQIQKNNLLQKYDIQISPEASNFCSNPANEGKPVQGLEKFGNFVCKNKIAVNLNIKPKPSATPTELPTQNISPRTFTGSKYK